MQPRPYLASDLRWSAAVALLVAAHFWTPRFGTGRGHDTYSTDAQGKKAFFALIQSNPDGQNRTVRRNTDPLARLVDARGAGFRGDYFSRRVICLLGPARYPNIAEWDMLLNWVSAGGRLVIAARDSKPDFRIEKLGIEVRRLNEPLEADGSAIQTDLIDSGRIFWRSNAHIIAGSGTYRPLQAHGSTQVLQQPHGSGMVIVVASDFIFSNQAMTYGDQSNAVLALSILSSSGGREVIFDESLNISGTPKVVGLLLNPLFKPLALQLLIALVLFAWWRSRRFGPLLPEEMVARRNIVDHTDSVGVLLYRSGDGAAALRAYLRQLFGELKLKSYRGREDRVIEPLAHRLGKSADAVKRVLQRAVKASKSTEVDRRDAAYMLRQLAVIRRAAQREKRPKRRKGPEEVQAEMAAT